MVGQGRIIGIILIAAGVLIDLGVLAWGAAGLAEGRLQPTGFALLLVLVTMVLTVPLVGAVNMDMVTLDVTDVPSAQVGGVVTLMAGRADHGPTALELAEGAGTTPYEILCHFGLRLPKQYLGGH